LVGPIAFGPVVEQPIMVGVHGGAKLLTSWLGSEKKGKGRGPMIFKGMHSMT
jgi:hypothetical protein